MHRLLRHGHMVDLIEQEDKLTKDLEKRFNKDLIKFQLTQKTLLVNNEGIYNLFPHWPIDIELKRLLLLLWVNELVLE